MATVRNAMTLLITPITHRKIRLALVGKKDS